MKYLYPSLRQGLVGAWYPSLGSTGYTLRDQSGYNNHATLFNMDAGTDWVASGDGLALDFDGSNDFVSANGGGVTSGTALTWSLWVKLNSIASYGELMCSQSDLHELRFASDLVKFEAAWNFPTGSWRTTGGPTVVAGVWYCVAITVTGAGLLTLFVDGVSYASNTSSHTTSVSGIYLGRRQSSLYLNGQLDDVLIYNRALSPNEIAILAQRRGIAYETMPTRSYKAPAGGGTNRRRRIICGGVY